MDKAEGGGEEEMGNRARSRLGLDLDGVVYDFHSIARFLLSMRVGYDLPPVEEIWSSWNGHLMHVSNEDDEWLWDKGVELGLYRHGHVLKGSIEALREIDEMVDIVVITHRPRPARQDTLAWLSFNQIPTSEIHMLHAREPKWKVPCDFYLDDKLDTVIDISTHAMMTSMPLLWDRPWNRAGGYAPRVRQWSEVVEWIAARV